MDRTLTAEEIVSKLTLDEKCSLFCGKNFWYLNGVERLGLPSIMVTDGPHGLRKQAGNVDSMGLGSSSPATCFPTAGALACSFDEKLIFEIGKALGEECRKENIAVLLGPGANEKRNPLCGRNFEYFSEDPFLSGKAAAAMIRGIQSQGVGTSLKHFAVNNQEKRRLIIDAVVDRRTLREIYLKAFEIAVKESQPWTVMTAYNKVNGAYCSEHSFLISEILRGEWGFEGACVSDWGALNDCVESVKAGLDIEMPGPSGSDALLKRAVQNGSLSIEALNASALHVIELILKYKEGLNIPYECDMDRHTLLACEAAENSAVLLKNDESLLPGKKGQTIAVVGAFAKQSRYQGAGSSKVNPYALDSAYEAFVQSGIVFDYADGYSLSDDNDHDDLLAHAVEAARGKDIVYIFAGLPDSFESEGFDRQNLQLPRSHSRLIEAIAAVNPNAAVILQGGSPMEMPWIKSVKAILLCYLGGSQGGKAAVNILLGRTNPSGKLAETFPLEIEDVASSAYFPGGDSAVQYRESIYVGYRYFDTAGKAVLFPFGYGLSYTQFRYDNLKIEKGSAVSVSFTITNTGSIAGKESVQLYISHRSGSIFKAKKELKAFRKVSLNPGKSAEIGFKLDNSAFEYFNISIDGWHVESGSYDILIGASSRDIRLQGSVDIKGDETVSVPDYRAKAPEYYNLSASGFSVSDASFRAVYGGDFAPIDKMSKKPFHRNSTVFDIKKTLIGRALMPVINRQVKTMAEDSEEMKLMLNAMIMDMPLRTFVMASKGAMNCRRVDGLADLLNGKILRGIKRLVTGR